MKFVELKLTRAKLLPLEALSKIVDHLYSGGVIALPTDTGYLLGVDALNVDAIKHVFKVKNRPLSNPIHVAVSSIEMARKYVNISFIEIALYQHFLPGPLTIVSPKKDIIPNSLVANKSSLGIRIPDTPVILQVCNTFGKPITATSANISGRPSHTHLEELKNLNLEKDEIVFYARDDTLIFGNASTVIDCTVTPPKVLREGPIEADKLYEFLKDKFE